MHQRHRLARRMGLCVQNISSEYILKVEWTGFTSRRNVVCKKREKFKITSSFGAKEVKVWNQQLSEEKRFEE